MRISGTIDAHSTMDMSMTVIASSSGSKRATNVTLSESLLAEAKALAINISKAAEAGVARAVAERRAELWRQENQEAIASSNAYVEQRGLPLRRYRMF